MKSGPVPKVRTYDPRVGSVMDAESRDIPFSSHVVHAKLVRTAVRNTRCPADACQASKMACMGEG